MIEDFCKQISCQSQIFRGLLKLCCGIKRDGAESCESLPMAAMDVGQKLTVIRLVQGRVAAVTTVLVREWGARCRAPVVSRPQMSVQHRE